MAHDFKRFPELTNSQMNLYYWDSPHKQITEDFNAKVIKVHDGDTIRVIWEERNFDFPVRFSNLAAPELNEPGGLESQTWLEEQILGEDVTILINQGLRVEKWGRLLGEVIHEGLSMTDECIRSGHGVSWRDRKQGKITDFDKEVEKVWAQ